MLIFNEQDNLIDNPDLDAGFLDRERKTVFHTYVVDTPEEGHFEQITYYPETGGSIVDWIIDTPEEGHWETRDESGNLITNYDGVIADDWVKENTIEDVWIFQRYKLYTDEQLADIAEQKRLAEEAAAKAAEHEAYLEEAPIVQEEILEGLAEVSDLTADNTVIIEEMMTAIVELGDVVAASIND